MSSTNWDTDRNPLEDLKMAADKIRKDSVLKPLTLIEKVFEAREAYLWALIHFPSCSDEYKEKYLKLKIKYEASC